MKKEPLSNIFKGLTALPETVWRDIEKSSKKLVDWLVMKGKLSAEEANLLFEELNERIEEEKDEWEQRVDAFITENIKPTLFPKREELTKLRQRVFTLIDRVESMEETLRKRQENEGAE